MSKSHVPSVTLLKHAFPNKKLQHIDVHPVKPWILFADKKGEVGLYDYEQNSLLQSLSLNSVYETKREEVALIKQLEKNYNEISFSNVDDSVLKQEKIGDLKSIRLYDEDVVYWNLHEVETDGIVKRSATSKIMSDIGKKLNIATIGSEDTFTPRRASKCIVLHTEQRVCMLRYDEASTSAYVFDEVRSSQIENKAITSIEFLYTQPMMALGGSDGTIRFWNYAKKRVIAKRMQAHSKAVVKMLIAHRSDMLNSLPSLLSCSADGSIASHSLDRESVEFHIPKAHGGDAIVDMMYDPQAKTITTIATDRTVQVRSSLTGALITKYKIKERGVSWSIGTGRVSQVASCSNTISSWCVFTAATPKLYRMSANLADDTWDASIDITSFVPVPPKIKPKIYSAQAHILKQNLIFCGSNLGLLVFKSDNKRMPNAAAGYLLVDEAQMLPPIPSTSGVAVPIPNRAQQSAASQQPGGLHRSVYYVRDHVLMRRSVHTTEVDGEEMSTYSSEQPVTRFRKGNVKIGCSKSGKFVSILWENDGDYEIYNTETWKIVGSGKNTRCLVWSIHTDTFATLYVDKATRRLSTYEISNGSIQTLCGNISGAGVISEIFGGHILGVAYEAEPESPMAFHFVKWDGSGSIGGFLPRPLLVEWDALSRHCLLAFEDCYVIFHYKPTFKMRCYVKEHIETAKWWNGSLFIVSSSNIKCVFPYKEGFESVLLASFDAAQYVSFSGSSSVSGALSRSSSSNTLSASANNASSTTVSAEGVVINELECWDPIPESRPKGLLSIADVVGDSLYVIDSRSVLHSISLSHSTIKFRMLVTAGRTRQALEWVSHIHCSLHDKLAEFLCKRGKFAQAAQLKTLTPGFRLRICLEYGLVDDALDTISAAMKSYSHSQDANVSTPTSAMAPSAQKLFEMHVKVGSLCERLNKFDKAAHCYRTAARFNVRGFAFLMALFVRQNSANDLKALISELSDLAQTKPSDESSELREQVALIAIFLKDAKLAVEQLQTASEFSLALAVNKNLSQQTSMSTTRQLVEQWSAELKQRYPYFLPVNISDR